jgi:signal transduction histidine kinase
LPKIKTFGAELHQVWTNLIDNSIDAITGDTTRPKPGGTIHVRTSRSGACAQVDIIDDGPGVAAEALPHLFEAFFTTKDVGKGTGLGLDIVRRIVNRHEGTVTVSPEPGATTFTVRLPFAATEEAKS